MAFVSARAPVEEPAEAKTPATPEPAEVDSIAPAGQRVASQPPTRSFADPSDFDGTLDEPDSFAGRAAPLVPPAGLGHIDFPEEEDEELETVHVSPAELERMRAEFASRTQGTDAGD